MDTELTTTIAEVTVYPERALVRHHGTLAIAEAGEHALRIGGLPQSVQRDSLRATGRGPAGTRILGIERPDRVAALVRIEVASAGEVAIDLSYLVSGASWLPRYDARVDVSSARVHLTQQALVTQRTGEDWADVVLALSTARPSAAATLPDEPTPWYIDVRKPMPVRPMMRALAAAPMA